MNKKRTIKKIKRKRKTKNRTKKQKTKKKLSKSKISKSKIKIIDVPFSRKENKGTKASKNIINYHYQHHNNISEFLHKLYLKKQIKNICFLDDLTSSMLEIDIKNKNVYPYFITLNQFTKYLNKCLKKKERFISLSINAELPQGVSEIENHANMLLIDKLKKQIELFEPHGYKPKMSTYSQSVQKYHKKLKLVKYFFKELLPEYNVVNVVDYIKDKNSFQSKYDSNSGYCVTWSLMYSHYRLLNPNIAIPILIDYLYKLINKNLLLRYAKYIEDTLKNKL